MLYSRHNTRPEFYMKQVTSKNVSFSCSLRKTMTDTSDKATFYDLSDLDIDVVNGDDATEFLQSQLSNDIQQLSQNQPHQLSAYCNPKGRVLAMFHILKLETGYALIAPRAILDKVLPRLRMFVMRSAVEIKPLDNAILFGLHATGDAKSEMLAALHARSTHIANHINDNDRFFILSDEKIEGRIKTNNDWNRLDIEQNLPQIYIETYEALIPQSVNLDIVGGVNFGKGCFPGQEIVARVKYRGKPKTRMIGVKTSPAKPVEFGAPVFIEGRNNAAGQVVNIATNDGFTLLSISVPVTHIYKGNVYLDEARTELLDRLSCPYEITV